MIKKLAIGLATGLMLFCFTSMANAISIGSGWESFGFGGVDSPWGSFDFLLLESAQLTVTDGYQAGDRFSVYNHATELGLTSIPTGFGDQIGSTWDVAATDPRWSTGVFLLTPGTYSIHGFAVDSPFGGGAAALRLDAAPVPEPATMLLLGTGLVGVAGAARRKKKNQS